ncbi:hypothetical protein [Sulfitobacter sp.]|jgi:hypothetical protein|uniref:hypothetical protein n=1 Tax=Sulfitobacter sp. TaxID=1903071 RepID=UPI0039E39361
MALITRLLICLAVFSVPASVFADESDLRLSVGRAEINDKHSFSASLLKKMQLEGELEIFVSIKNTSEAKILDLNLVGCAPYEVDGEARCAKTFNLRLEDRHGNDLKGGTSKLDVVLYPGESSTFSVFGRRPVGEDGFFQLEMFGQSVTGYAK